MKFFFIFGKLEGTWYTDIFEKEFMLYEGMRKWSVFALQLLNFPFFFNSVNLYNILFCTRKKYWKVPVWEFIILVLYIAACYSSLVAHGARCFPSCSAYTRKNPGTFLFYCHFKQIPGSSVNTEHNINWILHKLFANECSLAALRARALQAPVT